MNKSTEFERQRMYEMSMDGMDARQIAKEFNLDYQYVRSIIKRERKYHGTKRDCAGKPLDYEVEKKTMSKSGEITFEEKVAKGDEEITPESVMASKGLAVEEWEVVSFTKNEWEQQTKDGDKLTLCQFKLVVRPRKEVGLTIQDIDNFFATHNFNQELPIIPRIYDDFGEVLEICCADLHCGLLAWRYETGEDYDLHICADKFLEGIKDIVERAKKKSFKQIYFVTLGDVLHVDNMQGTTTKGTIQQTDGRITKIFDFAYDTMNNALKLLRELDAPINYVYLCGNHDTVMGYALAKMLEATNQDIYFDTAPNPQKAIHFGKCLIGLSHGDMPKSNKGKWLMNDYRREFGASDFIEEHSGHIHTEEAKEYNGILVRSLMAQCGNSYWEHQQGYRSKRGIQCFVWNEDRGLRESWYYYY